MSVKIIAGKFKGMCVDVPSSARPTLARARQTLFDTLESLCIDRSFGEFFKAKTVIDCFAGSGAVGLEALSRGAQYAYFVDKDKDAIKILKSNVAKTNSEKLSEIIHSDITKLKKNNTNGCDFAFLDPPFHANIGIQKVIEHLTENEWIKKDAILVIETPKEIINLQNFKTITYKKIGNITFTVYINCNKF